MTIAKKMAENCITEIEYHYESSVVIVERLITIIGERSIQEALDAYMDGDHIDVLDDIRKNRWWETKL